MILKCISKLEGEEDKKRKTYNEQKMNNWRMHVCVVYSAEEQRGTNFRSIINLESFRDESKAWW